MEENITVLIVEDDKYIMSLTTIYLKDEGYKTIAATTGKESLLFFYANNKVSFYVSIKVIPTRTIMLHPAIMPTIINSII